MKNMKAVRVDNLRKIACLRTLQEEDRSDITRKYEQSLLLRPYSVGTNWPLNHIMFFGCRSRFCTLIFQKAFAMQPSQFKKPAKSTVKALALSVVSGEVAG
jgi:hypothetical protein